MTIAPLPPEEPKLVLLDMDGVLVDSMPIHDYAWRTAADKYKLKYEEGEFFRAEGMKGRDTIILLYRKTFDEDPTEDFIEEVYAYKTHLFEERQADLLRPIPHVRELILYLKEVRGIDLGVVTGSTTANALSRIGTYFEGLFTEEQLITADKVEKGKPDPEPYLRGMSLTGHSAGETLVVENAPLGVRSAVAAGAFTVAVATGPIPEEILRHEGANLIFPNMRALLAWWRVTYGEAV
ncbi:MAG: HAD hydrolase-like protein [Porphyromonas sp.]|uniref:HAD family hydrolase n=1 Tax=Porphyromonas sp. TaxID=1924944 RepID=UPI002A91470A|nr:HAD family hydrolase [Porphyromonas sp.]MDD7468146.1 HAD hydrolase-like protein [Bacteroidales bacterium]MDY6102621.1 HAD hydrolase-like protein [Porphyromonas sp.]